MATIGMPALYIAIGMRCTCEVTSADYSIDIRANGKLAPKIKLWIFQYTVKSRYIYSIFLCILVSPFFASASLAS